MIGRKIAVAFQFHLMAPAIDVINRRDPINERNASPVIAKEDYGKDILAFHIAARVGQYFNNIAIPRYLQCAIPVPPAFCHVQ